MNSWCWIWIGFNNSLCLRIFLFCFLQTLMEMLKDQNIINPGWVLKDILAVLNGVINNNTDFTVFIKLTVHQLLWGYHNPVLHILKQLKVFFSFLPPINEVVALQVILINCTFGNHYQADNSIRIKESKVISWVWVRNYWYIFC